MRSARIDPIRQHPRVMGARRRQLEERLAELGRRLAELERQLLVLARVHRTIRKERQTIADTLRPVLFKRGRRPRPDGTEQLPALPHDATWLYGRKLRSQCLDLLEQRGPLPLPELHALLHRLGYGIDSAHPVKALADAMAYETELGHAQRIERGVYGIPPGTPRRTARPAA